jgi:hypothetical protein
VCDGGCPHILFTHFLRDSYSVAFNRVHLQALSNGVLHEGFKTLSLVTSEYNDHASFIAIAANEDKDLGTIQEPGMYSVTENDVNYLAGNPAVYKLPCLSKFAQLATARPYPSWGRWFSGNSIRLK